NIIIIGRETSYSSSYKEVDIPGVSVKLVPTLYPPKNLFSNYRGIIKELTDGIAKCDIVMYKGMNGYFANKIAKRFNKTSVAYIGGCTYDTLINIGTPVKKALAWI